MSDEVIIPGTLMTINDGRYKDVVLILKVDDKEILGKILSSTDEWTTIGKMETFHPRIINMWRLSKEATFLFP